MRKTLNGFMLLMLVLSASVLVHATPISSPEIDPGSAVSALALLSGALVVVRAAARK